MRLVRVPLLVFALLLVAGPALAEGTAFDQRQTEVSTDDVTCTDATTCQAPSVTARAGVDAPDASAEAPNPSCGKIVLETGGDADRCQPRSEIEPGTVTAYVGVQGLDRATGNTHSSQGQQAPNQGGNDAGALDIDTESALLVGALGIGASGAAAAFGLRRFVTVLLAPLASRLKRSELLENDTRRDIYQRIKDDPGVNLRGLADGLDLAWGTLLHHLHKLEDAHMIVSKRYGKYRRFFLNGSTYSKEEQARLAALSTPSTARVAEYILEHPGANQSEIGDAIGVTPSTVLFHVRRLQDVDLIDEEREGRYVHYYPNIQEHEAEQMAVA